MNRLRERERDGLKHTLSTDFLPNRMGHTTVHHNKKKERKNSIPAVGCRHISKRSDEEPVRRCKVIESSLRERNRRRPAVVTGSGLTYDENFFLQFFFSSFLFTITLVTVNNNDTREPLSFHEDGEIVFFFFWSTTAYGATYGAPHEN